jgi:PhzF family phenazine biosynthesis protein
MDVDVQRWTAFTTDAAAGNPAGVVVLEEPLDLDAMLVVAAEVGFSETAFLHAADDPATWHVRYVAPAAEVPFCGHATIATGVALLAADPTLQRVVLRTRTVGDVVVDLDTDRDGHGTATLASPPPRQAPLAAADLDALLGLFGWTRDDLDPAVPVAVAHAGADHPVLPLRSRATLAAMAYPFEELRTLMVARGWTTVQVVHRDGPATWHARDPFAAGGVVEDPATGAAAAALGGHLRASGLLPSDGRFTVLQGHDMGRPSVLHVDAAGEHDAAVRVTGTAVPLPG